jgi:hypothetical protein
MVPVLTSPHDAGRLRRSDAQLALLTCPAQALKKHISTTKNHARSVMEAFETLTLKGLYDRLSTSSSKCRLASHPTWVNGSVERKK